MALAQSSLAADAEPAPAVKASAAGPLKVWLEASAALDREKLRASLSRELRREVELTNDAADATVQVKVKSAAKAEVRYTTPSGQALTREVELPADGERSVQVVSWLTVNLVRDEAAELLDELRARRKEEAEARAAADRAAAEARAAADKAAAEKAASDKAAADKAAAEAARERAQQPATRFVLPPPPPPPLLRELARSFDLALATPISTTPDSPKRELMVQLALGYGDAGGLRGAAISPSVLRVRRDLLGAAVGAAAVFVGANARGAIVSAGYSQLEGNLEGIQVGGGVALQRGRFVRGVVTAVGGAIAGDVEGAVLGGGVASSRSLEGAAVAAGATVTRGPSHGVLIAGGVNFSGDHDGLEIAGGVNAARDLRGLALAPVNVHRKVKGLQIGIVNIAEEVDGAQLGVISISKDGRFQPVLWGSSDGGAHLALKSISGWAFTQLGGGIAVGKQELSYDGGAGLHLRLSGGFFLEPGVHYSATHSTEDASGAPDAHRLHVLALLGWRVGNKLDLLVGGGVRNTVIGGDGSALLPEARAGIAFF
jgi:hypothetical protein